MVDLQLLVTIFITATVASASATPLVLRIANVYGLYDQPDINNSSIVGRKIHSRPTPRLGGIPILISFLICFWVWKSDSSLSIRTIIPSLLIFLLGIFDDITPISARTRFGLQLAICSFAVISANLVITKLCILPGFAISFPWWLGLLFSTFVVVGAINALNMIDGLDGLAGGISIISCVMLSYLNFLLTKDLNATVYLCLPIVGAVIGFLKYNTHPASIFMGDSGSNWLGFMIGIQILMVLHSLSSMGQVAANGTHNQIITLVSVIMCFALPILDTAFVIFSRIKAGAPPMLPDKRHFHHSLVQIGFSQTQSVTIIYFLCILAGTMGLSPLIYPRYQMTWVPFVGGLMIFLIIDAAMSMHTRSRGQGLNSLINFSMKLKERAGQVSTRYLLIVRIWERVNKYSLFIALAISPIFAGNIPSSIGYVAIPILIFLLFTVTLKSQTNDFFESLAIALACLTLVAANNQNPLKVILLEKIYSLQSFYNFLFIFIFISSLGFLVLTFRRKHLILSPSDFLILSFPLILTILPEYFRTEYRIEAISLRFLIVYICYRTLEKRKIQSRRHIRMAASMALIYLIAISLLGLRIIY